MGFLKKKKGFIFVFTAKQKIPGSKRFKSFSRTHTSKLSAEREKRDRGLGYPLSPGKMRYQPGRDRARHHKKK